MESEKPPCLLSEKHFKMKGCNSSKQIDNMYANTYVVVLLNSVKIPMKTLTATQARKDIYRLLDETSDTHQPIQIIGKRSNAVLIGEDDWRSIQETLYLASIPGMQESIIEGIQTPLEETEEELDW